MKPDPDVYQDERFSTPQFVYDKKGRFVAQVCTDENGDVWVRKATHIHNDWGEWVNVKLKAI